MTADFTPAKREQPAPCRALPNANRNLQTLLQPNANHLQPTARHLLSAVR